MREDGMASRGLKTVSVRVHSYWLCLEGISLHNKRARCFLESAWIGATLFVAVGDSAAREIVGRHLDAHTIADQDPDAVLAHLAGDHREHNVLAVLEPDFEKGVGLLVDNRALRWNQIISCQ